VLHEGGGGGDDDDDDDNSDNFRQQIMHKVINLDISSRVLCIIK
jgi:hypothetical protein